MQQQLFGNNRESGRHDGHGAGFAFFHALIMEKLCFTCDPAKDAATVTYGSRMLAGEEGQGGMCASGRGEAASTLNRAGAQRWRRIWPAEELLRVSVRNQMQVPSGKEQGR
jgi:hypothetical protein